MTVQPTERRHFTRKIGDGLVVIVDGRVYPVVNISVSGISFQGTGFSADTVIRMSLATLHALEDCVEAQLAIKVAEAGMVRGEFLPTTRLMRYIVAHMGEVTGTKPAYFR